MEGGDPSSIYGAWAKKDCPEGYVLTGRVIACNGIRTLLFASTDISVPTN